MWPDYFVERAHVHGVDANEAGRADEDERTKIFVGDQAGRSFWADVRKAAPVLDIVIDDGGHVPNNNESPWDRCFPICARGVFTFVKTSTGTSTFLRPASRVLPIT